MTELRTVEIHTDCKGLVGFVIVEGTRLYGFIEAWCNWEWEDIGLCRPLSA